jgi:hypothetical protein
MADKTGCDGSEKVVHRNGREVVEPIPYGDPKEEWEKFAGPEFADDPVASQIKNPHVDGRHCHDCGTPAGGFHHPGCDMERCPFCLGQLISCGCVGSDE